MYTGTHPSVDCFTDAPPSPSIRGIEGPVRSISRIPTRAIRERSLGDAEDDSESASCAETDDLPTPPLPDSTRMMCETEESRRTIFGSAPRCDADGEMAELDALILTKTAITAIQVLTARKMWCNKSSRVQVNECVSVTQPRRLTLIMQSLRLQDSKLRSGTNRANSICKLNLRAAAILINAASSPTYDSQRHHRPMIRDWSEMHAALCLRPTLQSSKLESILLMTCAKRDMLYLPYESIGCSPHKC